MAVIVRDASAADLPQILALYNASIVTTSTWADEPQTIDDRIAWYAERQACGDGVLVADDGDVVGFSAYGEFRDNALWPAYRFSVENSVHVRDGFHGRGIGRLLMERLCDHAIAAGKHTMVAAVAAENVGSVRFHEALGFVEVGRLPELGWKFDRWLDLVLLQRRLV